MVSAALAAMRLGYRFARRAAAQLAWRRFPRAAERLLQPFHQRGNRSNSDFDGLVRYFAQGWRCYRRPDRAGASYPGLPSWSGRRVDELEGFSRLMPLFGAWCASGRAPTVQLPGGEPLSLADEFREGLVAGTDPTSPSYWGTMAGRSPQQIVEAADISLALWFFRPTVWQDLSPLQRERVARWLAGMEECPGLDKNWHLFYVLTDRVLESLGWPGLIPSARRRFERVKEFHLGDGWFTDGPAGPVDYYNAWGFHYPLYWIHRIDPSWDPAFIQACSGRFLGGYRFLIGPEGFPMLGRSIPYRLAAPAPLVLWHGLHADIVSPGLARRALEATWSYFIRRGAVRHGMVTQGYFGPDSRLVDSYSGPASSFWSLRSLVAAFSFAAAGPFWTSTPEPLPVEVADVEVRLEGPGWLVRGEHATQALSIEVLRNDAASSPPLASAGLLDHVRSIAYGRPVRPKNDEAKYGRRVYRSDRPLGCD
jgi:hypothetical protein